MSIGSAQHALSKLLLWAFAIVQWPQPALRTRVGARQPVPEVEAIHYGSCRWILSPKLKKALADVDNDEKESTALLTQILNRTKELGADVSITCSGLDEECERELEQERHNEIETERETPEQTPKVEQKWDFSSAFKHGSRTVAEISDTLQSFIAQRLSLDLEIGWADADIIRVTKNFSETLKDDHTLLDQYLRPVDSILLYDGPHGRKCLLLSDWEADQLLGMLWSKPLAEHDAGIKLVNLAYLCEALNCDDPMPATPLQVPGGHDFQPCDAIVVTALQLFAGKTRFAQDLNSRSPQKQSG